MNPLKKTFIAFIVFTAAFVTLQAAAPGLNLVATGVTCNGGADGKITVTATGGTAPYTYSRDGGQNYQTSNVFTGLTAGSYSITVKDAANLVSAPKNANVIQPTAVNFAPQLTNPTCGGGTNGRIYFVPNGGVSPHNYTINGGVTWQTSNNFAGLTAGAYNLQVRDSRGCLSQTMQVVLTQPTKVVATATSTNITCFGMRDGTITVTGTGGTPPYQYTINNGINWQTAQLFTGLREAATYIIRVKDANGCISDLRGATVSGPNRITMPVTAENPSCAGVNDGSITANPFGGHHGFLISIDSGQTYLGQNRFAGLGAGTYWVVARDFQGCMGPYVKVELEEPAPLGVTLAVGNGNGSTSLTCNSANGTPDGKVTATTTGGTEPYQYLWSNGQTSATATGVGAGRQSVTVTDSKGCTVQSSVTLTEPAPMVATPAPCASVYLGYEATECVQLSASLNSGGVAPITYKWSTGETTSKIKVCPTTSTLYSVTMTDANGCTVENSYRVVATDARCGNRNEKVSVCHYPPGNPGNPQQICIAKEAVGAHLSKAYGHYGCHLGPCEIKDPCNYTPPPARVAPASTTSFISQFPIDQPVSFTQLLFEGKKEDIKKSEAVPSSVQEVLSNGVLRAESSPKGSRLTVEKASEGLVKITVVMEGKVKTAETVVIRDLSGKVLQTVEVQWENGKFEYQWKYKTMGGSIQVTLRAEEKIVATRILKL